jgi:NTP pyrophosphatase (non-canonical NTP hydrolase)
VVTMNTIQERNQEVYEKAAVVWGTFGVINVAKEECAELIVALCKIDRTINKGSFKDLASEVADVEIMLEQIKLIFKNECGGNFEDLVSKEKDRKIKRLENRLNKEIKKDLAKLKNKS